MFSSYYDSLDNDSKQRYKEKLVYTDISFNDLYALSGWVDNIKKWPSIEFGDIYTYLIEFPNAFNTQAMKAYKSLEA